MKQIRLSAFVLCCAWLILALAFKIQRLACTPLLSIKCAARGWEKIGDLVLLTWVDSTSTMVSGVMAVTAALIGAWYLNRQIRQSEQQELDRKTRRQAAVRASLPDALSQIVQYGQYIVRINKDLHGVANSPGAFSDALRSTDFPDIPERAVGVVLEMIEAIDTEKSISLADLLSEMQVTDSRMRELFRNTEIIVPYMLEEYMLDGAEICARADAWFEYARRQSVEVPVTAVDWGRVRANLWFAQVMQEDFPRTFERIDRRQQSQPPSG